MNKIIFEGSEEQIKNLKKLMSIGLCGDNKDAMPTQLKDVYIGNLWNVDDVQSKFKCTDEEAMGVLDYALQNEATMGQIWSAIEFHGEDMGLTKKREE